MILIITTTFIILVYLIRKAKTIEEYVEKIYEDEKRKNKGSGSL